ncbi:ATP-binding cassette domain-containing protein [Pleurocapsales cyanobacterium LEGE 10410]|nr:ATP-binding cassette domain-containing protein [Pleurocapsales cyanobacterium LEGE 10410]
MAKVIVENVYKSYRGRVDRDEVSQAADRSVAVGKASSKQVSVLQDINFTVEDGEFLVLVGPSGCGKSTLLRLLAGLEELTGGNIRIGDRTVNDLPPKARDIAMVFQNYALYPHLNIYDNLAFGLRRSSGTGRKGLDSGLVEDILTSATRYLPRSLRHTSAKEKTVRDRVRYVASLLQIEPLLYRLPKELSGGQKQRVALGRAISRNPQVFLMDEPLSNLDAKLRTQTRAQIVQLQRQLNTTTIYVTHDQTEAMTMGDRIAVMNNGQIQQIAHPLKIYQQPVNRFVAEFIGSPPMNFLPVDLVAPLSLIHQYFKLDLPQSWTQSLQSSRTKSLVLGIRPQHLSISTNSASSIQATVDLVEALGNETYIFAHLTADPQTRLTVSLPPEQSIAIGDRVWLTVDLDKIHLFTVDEGRAIVNK